MVIDFNKGWNFYKDGNKEHSKIVHLPHDAMLTEPRYLQTNNGERTGYFPGGKYFYEKELQIPGEYIGKYIALLFEGVYRHATVLINGVEVGFHAYGYTEFEVDISDMVVIGNNKVTVIADNSYTPNSRWYSGSGIYRPVHFIVKEKSHIKNISTTTISHSPAVIQVEVESALEKLQDKEVNVEIYDGKQLIITGTPGRIEIPNAKLWSAENPNLYTAVIKYKTEESRIDFGIRFLHLSAAQGLLVNGIETKLRGCCIHHDNGILGACAFADAEERRVRIMKEAGYNAIRSAHNPCSRALLDACDKYGMYVIDELYDGWYTPKTHHDSARDFADTWEKDAISMVEKDKNHPSVIMYSTGNEVTEPSRQKGIETAGELAEKIRSLDPSRPITCGINIMLMKWDVGIKENGEYKKEYLPDNTVNEEGGSAFFNAMMLKLGSVMGIFCKGKKSDQLIKGASEKLDIVGLNYGEYRYVEDGQRNPDRVLLGSETLVSRQWYNWPRVLKYKYLIGDFVWTGFDYLGETSIGQWVYENKKGIPLSYGGGTIDLIGNLDAQCYYQQAVWGSNPKPYIGVRPLTLSNVKTFRRNWRMTDVIDSWTWPGYEGKTAEIEVYTNGAKLELILNGKSLGVKKVKKYKVSIKTKYLPGTLEAIAYNRNGKAVDNHILKTAGEDTILKVVPEKNVLQADGQDLCFISVDLTDRSGRIKPAQEKQIKVKLEGEAAELIALGSANPKTDEVFDKHYHYTYFGRALIVLRAGYKSGNVKVIVQADDLKQEEVEIQVIEA